MTSLLILTVGTGTSAKHSDMAPGLPNSIRQVPPSKAQVVNSKSQTEMPLALIQLISDWPMQNLVPLLHLS